MCSSPAAPHRTDLYLTVGPEPLGPDDERPHPSQEPRAPEELLARVLTRDGSKTLASDTPDLPDVRRLSTRELRAERDRLAALRAACPPDRSRELRWPPGGRPRPSRPASRPAPTSRPPPTRSRPWPGAGGVGGSCQRQGAAGAGRACVSHDHRPGRPGGRAARAPAPGPAAAPGLDGSPRRRPARPGAGGGAGGCLAAPGRPARRRPGPAGLAAGRTRPRPHRPQASGRCGAWPLRNWTATGAPTASTTHRRRSMAGGGWPGTGGRLRRPRPLAGEAGRRDPQPARAPPPRRAPSPPAAAGEPADGGRPAPPSRPGPAAGRRTTPRRPRPPPRLAQRLGRAGAPGRPPPPP